MNLVEKNVTPKSNVIQRRIGSTLYKVNVHFSEGGKETLKEKVLRLMKNDLSLGKNSLHFGESRAIIKPLQAGWSSEGGCSL